MADPKSVRAGTLRVRIVQPGVIGTAYTGYISTRLVEDKLPEFVEALRLPGTTHWVVDAIAVTGFDPKMLFKAASWLSAFKEQGGHTMHLAAQSSSVRMAGSSLSFAAGLSIKGFDSIEEAIEALPTR